MGASRLDSYPGTRLAPTQGCSWAGKAEADTTPRGSGQVADKTGTGHPCSLPSCSELSHPGGFQAQIGGLRGEGES